MAENERMTWNAAGSYPPGYPTEYMRMVGSMFSRTLPRFIQRSAEYHPDNYKFLGVKGQFSDLSRKFMKIKAVVWDHTLSADDLQNEDIIEIIDDMIGHLMIMRDLITEDDQ